MLARIQFKKLNNNYNLELVKPGSTNSKIKLAVLMGINDFARDRAYGLLWGAYLRESLKAKFNFFMKSAYLGNKSAQKWLGYCYTYGLGVPASREIADKWFEKSVNNRCSDFKYWLNKLSFGLL